MTTVVDTATRYLPRLELPSWLNLYPTVANQAEEIYDWILQEDREYNQLPADERLPRGCTVREQIELLTRLAADQRMNRVWRELYRKRRGSNEFLNPVKRESFPDGEFTTLHDPKNQDIAVRAFLKFAFWLGEKKHVFITQDEIDSHNTPLIRMASRLRKDARALRALDLNELATTVEAIAADCERRAIKLRPTIILPIVTRSRGDVVMRGFVLRMSVKCREWFGKALPGTVATTASVALSKKITGHQVRDIVRAHDPGVSLPTET